MADLRPGDIDLSDPETFADGVPHTYFRVLREQSPVHWQPECKLPGVPQGPGYWALTRYVDIAHVSKNADLFSSGVGSCVLSDLRPKDLENMRKQMINMDAPDHTQLRKVMHPHFKPGVVRETEEHTRKIVVETLDQLEGQGACDFVDAVSAPISLRALTHFLGVPDKHSKRFYNWTNLLIGASDPEVSSNFRARLAVLELFIYAALLRRKRRRAPTGDIFSALVNAQVDGRAIENLTLGMNFFLLVIAGNETTRNALSGGVQALCDHPDQLALLQAEPERLPDAIEELLRWVTPVMQFRRTATRDTEVGGQAIRRGEKIVMYYGAGNRDPAIFDNPDVFDITRKKNPHLAFGTGTHFCAGSHMARLEMRITLEEFLRRFPRARLDGPPLRLHSNFIGGIKQMPMLLS